MTIVSDEGTVDPTPKMQSGTLMHVQQQLGQLFCDTVERLARDTASRVCCAPK